MYTGAPHNGWSRIAANLDVEIQHGIPVRVTSSDNTCILDENSVAESIAMLTGFTVSVQDRVATDPDEQQWSISVSRHEFGRVLLNQALASAAIYVDRFHKPVNKTAVDWDLAEFNHDFNVAIERCCLPYDSVDRNDYFEPYVNVMHEESQRLIEQGISPLIEAE